MAQGLDLLIYFRLYRRSAWFWRLVKIIFVSFVALVVIAQTYTVGVPKVPVVTNQILGVFSKYIRSVPSGRLDWPQTRTLTAIETLYRVKEVDCKPLFGGDKVAIQEAVNISSAIGVPLSDDFYLNSTVDCQHFTASRGYIMSSLTQEELDFPLAFSMIVYKDSEMVERFLRAIYRPQNYYCIHVDKKASDKYYKAISAIANCFPNVFLTSRRIDVQWGKFSVLEPELLCMEELWRYKDWKYFFTTTGQEFPLRTNYELVSILKAYNGANDISSTIKRANKERWKKGQPPAGLRLVKGSVHITANRDFIDYMLHNATARKFLEWSKGTLIPDETFFATLNHNPQLGIRGTYKGEPETRREKPFLTRYKNWGSLPCAAKRFVRGICILSTGDLPVLGTVKHFFANKFYLHEDRAVIGCLEELLFNRTRDEYLGYMTFNTTYYSSLDFVNNQVTK